MDTGPTPRREPGANDTAAQARSPAGRLLIAGHFVRTGRVGGAEQMLYNLVRGLAALGVDTTLLCGRAADLSDSFRKEIGAGLREAGGTGSRFLAEQRACLDRSLGAEAVLFPNYHLPPVVPRRLGRRGVVLHDLQYRHFPQHFSRRKRLWLRAAHGRALRGADRVFVISEFVRRDVVRLYGTSFADRLVVAPNPVSWERFGPPGDARPMERPYILSVCAQYPHKNLATLVRGFAELARRERDVQLVLCGQDHAGLVGVAGASEGLRPLLDSLGIAGRVHLTGYLGDAALGRWYRHAALFAFPSLFEGFGMPPVEALGFGLPVLATALTAVPEVTLGLAHAVDAPEDPAAWASHLADLLRRGPTAAPAPADVARIRHTYSPATCAARYREALLGGPSKQARLGSAQTRKGSEDPLTPFT